LLNDLTPTTVSTFCDQAMMHFNSGKAFAVTQCIQPLTLASLRTLLPVLCPREVDTTNWDTTWDIPTLCTQLRQAFPRVGSASSVAGVVDTLRRIRPNIGEVPSRAQATQFVTAVTHAIQEGSHLGAFNQKMAVNALLAGIIDKKDANGLPRNVTHCATRLHDTLKAFVPPLDTVQGLLSQFVKTLPAGSNAMGFPTNL